MGRTMMIAAVLIVAAGTARADGVNGRVLGSNKKGGKKIVKSGPIRSPFKDAILKGGRSNRK